MAGRVYHWKHGWIPLDHYAALKKAHGSETGARKYGFSPVAHEHLKRDSHIVATHSGRDNTFRIKDLSNGRELTISHDRARQAHESGRIVTRVSSSGQLVTRADPNDRSLSRPVTRTELPRMKHIEAKRQFNGDFVVKDTETGFSGTISKDQLKSIKQNKLELVGVTAMGGLRTKMKTPNAKAKKNPAWLDQFGATHTQDHRQAFEGANPGFNRMDRQTFINCAKATQAYELRRRGVRVEATYGSAGLPVTTLAFQWSLPSDPTGAPRVHRVKSRAELEAKWVDDPPGARYMVTGAWHGQPPGGNGSHIWNAEKQPDGSIRYFDAQVREADASGYFGRLDTSNYSIQAFRVDNATPKKTMLKHLTKGRIM